MNILEQYLTVNEYSRPGRTLKEVRAFILHWVGGACAPPTSVRHFFENASKEKHYSSAHYCVGLNGDVYHLVPDDEVAYHCGSSQKDPGSGRIYTDWAREAFGKHAEDPEGDSPNNASIGIVMCVADNDGNYTGETLRAAAELTAQLCKTYHVPLERVGTHHMVVGWKDCPRLWTRYPQKFEEFLKTVKTLIDRKSVV
jgi:N-acetylmuramoyl-L-alanine amidase